jgi:hypothetical protein
MNKYHIVQIGCGVVGKAYVDAFLIKASRTKITCLVDDDIICCPIVIENMILPLKFNHHCFPHLI